MGVKTHGQGVPQVGVAVVAQHVVRLHGAGHHDRSTQRVRLRVDQQLQRKRHLFLWCVRKRVFRFMSVRGGVCGGCSVRYHAVCATDDQERAIVATVRHHRVSQGQQAVPPHVHPAAGHHAHDIHPGRRTTA